MLAQNCESDGSMSGMPSQCGRKRGSVPDGAASQGMSTMLSRRCLWGVADRASPVVADYIPTDRDMSRVRNGNPYRFLIGVGHGYMLCSNFGLVSPFQLWMEKPPLWARLLLPILRHTFPFFFHQHLYLDTHTYARIVSSLASPSLSTSSLSFLPTWYSSGSLISRLYKRPIRLITRTVPQIKSGTTIKPISPLCSAVPVPAVPLAPREPWPIPFGPPSG